MLIAACSSQIDALKAAGALKTLLKPGTWGRYELVVYDCTGWPPNGTPQRFASATPSRQSPESPASCPGFGEYLAIYPPWPSSGRAGEFFSRDACRGAWEKKTLEGMSPQVSKVRNRKSKRKVPGEIPGSYCPRNGSLYASPVGLSVLV
jgi:hypothetical protein